MHDSDIYSVIMYNTPDVTSSLFFLGSCFHLWGQGWTGAAPAISRCLAMHSDIPIYNGYRGDDVVRYAISNFPCFKRAKLMNRTGFSHVFVFLFGIR